MFMPSSLSASPGEAAPSPVPVWPRTVRTPDGPEVFPCAPGSQRHAVCEDGHDPVRTSHRDAELVPAGDRQERNESETESKDNPPHGGEGMLAARLDQSGELPPDGTLFYVAAQADPYVDGLVVACGTGRERISERSRRNSGGRL